MHRSCREAVSRETELIWKIRDLQHQILYVLQNNLQCYGLHVGQPRILHVIAAMHGASQKEIALQMDVSPASISNSLQRLEKAGLVRRDVTSYDSRQRKIMLTQAGERVMEESCADLCQLHKQLCEGLSTAEMDLLESCLMRMMDNLGKWRSGKAVEAEEKMGEGLLEEAEEEVGFHTDFHGRESGRILPC